MRYIVACNHPHASMPTADPKPATVAAKPVSTPQVEPEEDAPQVEHVNIAGLVLNKTVYPDGECETQVLREPMIEPELVRSTRASQRARGH